jgi:hypothetical protein
MAASEPTRPPVLAKEKVLAVDAEMSETLMRLHQEGLAHSPEGATQKAAVFAKHGTTEPEFTYSIQVLMQSDPDVRDQHLARKAKLKAVISAKIPDRYTPELLLIIEEEMHEAVMDCIEADDFSKETYEETMKETVPEILQKYGLNEATFAMAVRSRVVDPPHRQILAEHAQAVQVALAEKIGARKPDGPAPDVDVEKIKKIENDIHSSMVATVRSNPSLKFTDLGPLSQRIIESVVSHHGITVAEFTRDIQAACQKDRDFATVASQHRNEIRGMVKQ